MPPIRQNAPRRQPRAPVGLDRVRAGLNQLSSGRSNFGSRSHSPEVPKTPRYTLGLPNLSSTRLVLPHLSPAPSLTVLPRGQSSPRDRQISSASVNSRHMAPSPVEQVQQPVSSRPSRVYRPARRFVGVDPAELHLANLAQAGRRRRRNNSINAERTCGPRIKNRKIRSKILSCFISGLFLTLILTIYLALALTNRNESQEFHVLLILIILVITIVFCHSLIRLCMMMLHPPPDVEEIRPQLPTMMLPGGYANPIIPIRVALTRDEEAAGIESEATKIPPPAYGLWRESVRVDPNRIFWQRNEAAPEHHDSSGHAGGPPTTANRPPSYISENGVDYVIEAAPRSIAPTTDVPLPPHPSERGRIAWPQA